MWPDRGLRLSDLPLWQAENTKWIVPIDRASCARAIAASELWHTTLDCSDKSMDLVSTV